MTMLHQTPQILKDLARKSPLIHFFLQDFKLVDEQNHPLSVPQHPVDVIQETAEDKGWVVIECFQPWYAHHDASLFEGSVNSIGDAPQKFADGDGECLTLHIDIHRDVWLQDRSIDELIEQTGFPGATLPE